VEAWQTTSVAAPAGADRKMPLVLANPAVGRVRMTLPLDGTGAVIMDAAGRRVRELRCRDSKDRVLTWDGCDEAGRAVPAGVYLISVKATVSAATQSVLLLR
jgi:flagellar hook assembly protein FlgD